MKNRRWPINAPQCLGHSTDRTDLVSGLSAIDDDVSSFQRRASCYVLGGRGSLKASSIGHKINGRWVPASHGSNFQPAFIRFAFQVFRQ